jgi:hypothetical protein
MRERLKAKRGINPTIAMVVVLGMVALVSVPWGVAGEGKSIAQKVREAKTPAEQQAIAAAFEKEAKAAHKRPSSIVCRRMGMPRSLTCK